MALVLDATIALAWLLPDEDSARAEQVVSRLAIRGGFAPSLLLLETSNALLQAERRARVPQASCDELLAALMRLPLIFEPIGAESTIRARALARAHALSIYDASYLDLAVQRRVPLATLDHALTRAAVTMGIEVIA